MSAGRVEEGNELLGSHDHCLLKMPSAQKVIDLIFSTGVLTVFKSAGKKKKKKILLLVFNKVPDPCLPYSCYRIAHSNEKNASMQTNAKYQCHSPLTNLENIYSFIWLE